MLLLLKVPILQACTSMWLAYKQSDSRRLSQSGQSTSPNRLALFLLTVLQNRVHKRRLHMSVMTLEG